MVFRYLRNLDAVSPPLSLTHLACQMTAKAFAATRKSFNLVATYYNGNLNTSLPVFDRMFSLGLRGSGTDTQPLGARVAAVAAAGATTGPRRHFLYCSLKTENQAKPKRSREGP